MKHLIVFYSRTKTTKKVAEALAGELDCDVEEIFDTKNRDGALGFMSAGRAAMAKKLTKLKDIEIDPSGYDMVILGTPVWAGTMSAPMRTYIKTHCDKFRKVAFFVTCNNDKGKAFQHMQDDCKNKPEATLELRAKEVKRNEHIAKVTEFAAKLK